MDHSGNESNANRTDNMPVDQRSDQQSDLQELFTNKIQETSNAKIEEIPRPNKSSENQSVQQNQQSQQSQPVPKSAPKFGLSLSSDDFGEPEPEPKPTPPQRPKIRIIAGVVTQDRRISMNTASSLQNAKDYLAKQDAEFKILYLYDKAEYIAKNKLLSIFLTTDSTHLLLIGDTLSFTPPILERLISADKPVICAACPMATRQWQQLVEWSTTRKNIDLGQIPTLLANYFINVANDKRNRRAIEDDQLFVDFAASDFMFLRRDCVEQLVKKFGTVTACVNVSTQNVENIYTLFEPTYTAQTAHTIDKKDESASKTYKTPDETFCERIRSCGIDIIVDPKAHIVREISGEMIHGNLNDLIALKQKKQ